MNPTALQVSILLTIGVGLTLYILFGGADFGGGVWDLLATGSSRERERELVAHAIGPVWEANHVWLIFVVTGLFAGFPDAFAALSIGLYVPFSLAIAGIVLRGAAFAFRAYGEPGTGWQRSWTRVFGIASLVTPVVLGMAGAAIASGRIRVRSGFVDAGLLTAWTGPLSWVGGALALSMCAFLAATFLTVESGARGDRDLEESFRRRAISSALVSGAFALGGLAVLRSQAPSVWQGMLDRGIPLVVASGIGGIGSVAALVRRRYRVARVASAAAVAGVIAGWGVAQWPLLIVPDLTVRAAAAPADSLRPIAVGFALGGVLLVPSLVILFRVFKSGRNLAKDAA